MDRRKAYKLHIQVNLKKASPSCTGKALGMLFREHLNPQQIECTTEKVNNSEVSVKAEMIIDKLLGRLPPWSRSVDQGSAETKWVLLDDEKVDELAERWSRESVEEYVIVVPHIFYKPLFQYFLRHLQLHVQEVLRRVCIFFDYAILEDVPEVVKKCFFGERAEVLEIAGKGVLPFFDPGRQLYLENVISLACYMIPANYLVFMDDDFFVSSSESLNKLLDPLKRGYLMTGRYVKIMDRLHTCFFGINPEALQDELMLFDNGENHYSDKSMDTGTITYRTLSKRNKGVFIIDNYQDDDLSLGRHLTHCATEMWVDLPQILRINFDLGMFPKEADKTELDTSILLEALSLLFDVKHGGHGYKPVDNDLRQKAAMGRDLSAYIGRVYNNYQWLMNNAGS